MRRSLLTLGIVVAMVAAGSIGRVQGQAEGDKVIFVSSSHANYTPIQASNARVTTSAVWGDANAGAHGTFNRFVPGYDAGIHTHTNDVGIVVVKGAYLYKDDAGEKRVRCGQLPASSRRPQTLERRRQKKGCRLLRRVFRQVRFYPRKVVPGCVGADAFVRLVERSER